MALYADIKVPRALTAWCTAPCSNWSNTNCLIRAFRNKMHFPKCKYKRLCEPLLQAWEVSLRHLSVVATRAAASRRGGASMIGQRQEASHKPQDWHAHGPRCVPRPIPLRPYMAAAAVLLTPLHLSTAAICVQAQRAKCSGAILSPAARSTPARPLAPARQTQARG